MKIKWTKTTRTHFLLVKGAKQVCQKDEFKVLPFKLPLTIRYQNLLSRENRYVAQKLFGSKKNVFLAETNYTGTFI